MITRIVDLWKRIGTTLHPRVANDNVDIGTGDFITTGDVDAGTHSDLTLTPQATGFTVAGGTAPKTLTVSDDASVTGTNTGDSAGHSTLVPYTGATGAVDLGTHGLTTTGTLTSGLLKLPTTTSLVGQLQINSVRVLHTYGTSNIFVGETVGNFTLTGSNNAAMGFEALLSNTSGASNAAMGYHSLRTNTSGNSNAAMGRDALFSNTSGANNSAIGLQALRANTTGANNSAIGLQAGRYITDGATANALTDNSVFIGALTKAKANNETNQIVIGYDAIGNGTNTATIGDDTITALYAGELGQAVLYAGGAIVAHNVADAVATATINNLNAGSTGNIINFQWQSINRAIIDRNGVYASYGYDLPHVVKKAASANVRNNHAAEATSTSAAYEKVKTITLTYGLVGAARFLFALKTSDSVGPTTAYGQIYRNGVALGTEQEDITGGYVDKSEDITQNWSPGDTCELWVKIADLETVSVQDFRIAYDDSPTITVASVNS